MSIRSLRGFAALSLVAAVSAAPAAAGAGEAVAYRFRSPLDNGLGLVALEDLRGKPVLVEFWGTR
jgi:hypothetical protein